MITPSVIDRFLAGARGQALREGTRYAREARVGGFVGSIESATTVVRGVTDDFEVVLWPEEGRLAHRCSCPSWRDPCKHEVAAALVLRQCLPVLPERDADAGAPAAPRSGGPARDLDAAAPLSRLARSEAASIPLPDPESMTLPDPEEARERALEERRTAARREKPAVSLDAPPLLRVGSASGFTYRVRLRGGDEGPHGCDCPDFEANRLHTCKHVERARTWLRAGARRLPSPHRRAASRPRVYLHFGEVIEPRLMGRASGPGAPAVRKAFDGQGIPVRPLARDPQELLAWLRRLGSWVEPEALEWLEGRARRRPALPAADVRRLVPPLPLAPYPYQWDGASFLATTGRALLADEMGLGKTIMALLAAAALEKAEPPAGHVTIVCPASLRGGWEEELRRWLGQEATLLEGPTLERARVIASRPRWLVTHYEQVLRDHRHHAAHPPDLLIVDEAQRAKGLRARTARALKAIPSRYLFALTGTPLENRMEEAYAIAQLIDQRLLPPLWQLDRDHFVRDRKGRRVVLYRNLDALRSRLAPAFLRRRKEDVALELPDRVRSIVTVPMHPSVSDTYESVMQSAAQIASKKVILPADLDRMQRLLVIARRCCDGPHMLRIKPRGRDAAIPKLEELEQSLRDLCLGEGRKAVVFSEWTDMTEPVEDLCARLTLPAFHLHGHVPVKERPALIRAFTGAKGPAVFVSTDAGGVGLNLQAADVVVNLDLPWNPARLEQRIARVHRIGSRRTVQEILVICKDSIEERILHLHATKRNVLENVWAKGGEDVIAAPGGSGSFQEMVRALIATRGPAPAEPAAATAAASPGEAEAGPAAEVVVSWPAVEAAASTDAPEEAGRSLPTAGRAPAAIPEAPAGAAPDRRTARAPMLAGRSPSPSPEESSTPRAPASDRLAPAASSGRAPSAGGVDPASVARAVAAVAPSLPAEHRRSLATVFRALAEALEA